MAKGLKDWMQTQQAFENAGKKDKLVIAWLSRTPSQTRAEKPCCRQLPDFTCN